MILSIGYNALRWTGPTQAIAALDWVAAIEKVYAHNPVTGQGYVGYTKGDAYPTLTTFSPGVDYLVDVNVAVDAPNAIAAVGAFDAFPGYVPPEGTTPPVGTAAPANVVVSATAAQDVIVGRLVGRVTDGVVMYDATDPDHRQRLLGIALNSANVGGTVNVQQRGTVLIPGLGLGTAGDVLHARDSGKVGLSSDGMAFQHIVGRTLTPDSFFLSSQSTYSL